MKRKNKRAGRRRAPLPKRPVPAVVFVHSSWLPDLIGPAPGEPYTGPLIRGEIVRIES